MATIYFKDNTKLDVRALEPTTSGFIFNALSLPAAAPLVADFSILDYENKVYKNIKVNDFTLNKKDDEYEFICSDKAFLLEFGRLLKDYTNYINCRLENDEITSMEKLSGLKLSEEYGFEPILKESSTETLLIKEIAISIDCYPMYEKFLELEYEDFLKFYWQSNCLEKHPISSIKPTHIYIGNQFCPNLFPNLELLERLLNRVNEFELTPVIVFSTMSENRISEYEKILNFLAKSSLVEIVINDYGIALLAKKLEFNSFEFTLGVLLNKRKKDARMISTFETRNNSCNADFFIEYLKDSYGIKSFSYEACGYDFDVNPGSVLHLGLYQTNTSGHCTMYALAQNHDRKSQEEVLDCPRFCENHRVLYPKNTEIIGRWNSLFALDETNFDFAYINKMAQKGIKRIVIRM